MEQLIEINIPPQLLQFFDQRQSCDVHANLQTANVTGKLKTNLGNTLIEKYSEIGNTGIFLKQTNDEPGRYEFLCYSENMGVKSSDRGTVSKRFRRLSSNIYFVYITV